MWLWEWVSVWVCLAHLAVVLLPWRHAAEQPAPAAHLSEVRWRQLRHRLRRLPHLHRPPGEHVQCVNVTIKPSTTSAVTYYIKWSKYRRRSHPRVTVQPSLPPRVSMESQVTFCKMQQATNHKIDNQMFVFSSTGVIQVLIWVSRSPEITRWNLYWSSWAKSVVWGEC